MHQNTSKPREKHIRGLCSCVYFTARYSYSWQSTEKFRNYYLNCCRILEMVWLAESLCKIGLLSQVVVTTVWSSRGSSVTVEKTPKTCMCIFSVERHFHSAVVVTPGIVILEVFILTGPKMNMVGTFDYNSLCLHWLFKTQSVDSLFPCLAGHTVCWYPVSMSRWPHSDTLFTCLDGHTVIPCFHV